MMIKQQYRSISFKSIKSVFTFTKKTPATELQKPLTSLPNATGAGAFVEPISYQVLGASSNLLNIKLPKSSILNIRYSNSQQKIIAMNGHINSMYTELARSNENNMIFQRCFNQKEPMSLLIAQNAQNSNFAIIETKKNNWVVKKSSLFAWSGPSIKPASSKLISSLVQMKGDGTFIVATPGQLTQIDLDNRESVQINTKTLVGYTTDKENIDETLSELQGNIRSVFDFGVGRASLPLKFNFLKKYNPIPASFFEDPTIRKISKVLSTVLNSIQTVISYVTIKVTKADKQGVFVELQGPKTIFLTNSVHIDDKILSETEIKKLIS
jgi:hypothetical protein